MAKQKKNDGAPAVKVDATYYCIRGQFRFTLPEYETDDFEKIIEESGVKKRKYKTDSNGNNKVLAELSFKFERVPVRDPHTGKTSAIVHVGRFIVKAENPRYDDFIDVLEKARKNRINGILTEDEYKQHHNPEAFSFEKEKILLSGELLDAKDEIKALRDKLAAAGLEV